MIPEIKFGVKVNHWGLIFQGSLFEGVQPFVLIFFSPRKVVRLAYEHEGLWPVPDQANQSHLHIYLINLQPLWDRSQIKLHKLFNALNWQIIA